MMTGVRLALVRVFDLRDNTLEHPSCPQRPRCMTLSEGAQKSCSCWHRYISGAEACMLYCQVCQRHRDRVPGSKEQARGRVVQSSSRTTGQTRAAPDAALVLRIQGMFLPCALHILPADWSSAWQLLDLPCKVHAQRCLEGGVSYC